MDIVAQRIGHLTHLTKHFDRDNRVGWISPDGHISGTEVWYHLQYFIDNEYACEKVFALLKPHWDDFNEPLQEEYRSGERRWHEWVDVPMSVEGELAAEAKSIAYGEGWARIGTFGNDKLELECFEEHRRKLMRPAREFAQLLSRELVVTVTLPFTRDADAPRMG